MFHDFTFCLGIVTAHLTCQCLKCQMCGYYSKTKSEIMKHDQKDHIIFCFVLNCRPWEFKQLLEKAKPTSVDSSSDKPKAPIRNVGSHLIQPFN